MASQGPNELSMDLTTKFYTIVYGVYGYLMLWKAVGRWDDFKQTVDKISRDVTDLQS